MESPYLTHLRGELERIKSGRRSERLDYAMRTGDFQGLSWVEMQTYLEWIGVERKDAKITIRMSGMDLMKAKYIARMKGMRYQTYLRDIVKREVRLEEERLAGDQPGEIGLPAGRRGAGAPR